MATVALGRVPDRLVVHLVASDPFGASMTYAVAGVPTAWPAAPVLTVSGVDWPATLSGDSMTATWEVSAELVTAAMAGTGRASLTLGGTVLASGVISRHA